MNNIYKDGLTISPSPVANTPEELAKIQNEVNAKREEFLPED